jgi:O-antigen/teichoic acid export membrane protein
MTKFSIPLTIGGLAYWGLSSVDRFMIRTFLGFDDLGLYSISVTFASYVVVITSVFSNIWHPTVYKWIDDGVNIDKISQVVKLSSFSICLLWCLSGVFSWIIPLVLPTDYSRVVYLFPVAVGGPLLYLLSETTVVGINISKKTVYSMIASITAVLSTAGLCYFLLPKVGVVGAAISSCLAYFLCFVMRSEFSMSLWIHLPIRRVYLAVTYLIFTSASIAIYEPDLKIIIAIWFASLIIITLFFWKEVIFIRKSLKVKLC